MNSSKRYPLLILLLLTGFYSFGWISVINYTTKKISVSFGYPVGAIWYASGWFEIDPGKEEIVYNLDVTNLTYYIYIKGVPIKGSQSGFCIDSINNFTLAQPTTCNDAQFTKVSVDSNRSVTTPFRIEIQQNTGSLTPTLKFSDH